MLTGIHIKAQGGVPYLLSGLTFPEKIGSNICLKPAGVDWIYTSFFFRH
jgi:hypothetical protein